MSDLFTAESIISLLTLTFLEIVLGIDNIIFISIAANKLDRQDQPKARNIGLILAMAFRLVLLLGISFVISLSKPFTHVDAGWFKAAFTGQSLILFGGGLFLLYKATSEIHHKLEGSDHDEAEGGTKAKTTISSVVTQIAITNIVFSIDSILTAIGLTQNVTIMMIAVVLSILIMMFFCWASWPLCKRTPHDSNAGAGVFDYDRVYAGGGGRSSIRSRYFQSGSGHGSQRISVFRDCLLVAGRIS